MKTKKLNLEDFATNELSKNQKKAILGKGDPTAQTQTTIGIAILVANSTTDSTPPGAGQPNGDARIV